MNLDTQEPESVWQGRSDALSQEWLGLCLQFLPITRDQSIWRFSHEAVSDTPEQGWKIHVSATVLTACWVLRKIAPLLQRDGVHFKAAGSLEEVRRINSGLHYGYSQVGKLITIYPRNDTEAITLARKLYEVTGAVAAPAVPFDQRFRPDGCIYLRYGAFRHLEVENPDGTRSPALRDPQGRLCPDARDSAGARPGWLTQSLIKEREGDSDSSAESPLNTTYRVFRALSQRGKGGVYQAVDLSADPPRLCVVKEGRRDGELSWDGRDGSLRIRNEERVLKSLQDAQVDVPMVYGSFELDDNYYVVTEFIEGETLQAYLLKRQRRISIAQGLCLGAQLASILIRIHSAGWYWRDCKPGNLMLTRTGRLRPLDFEGACPIDQPDPLPWGTPGFTPPKNSHGCALRANEDLYGLGVTLNYLFTGRLPLPSSPFPIPKYRRGVPGDICDLIAELLAADSSSQPSVELVGQKLQQAQTQHPARRIRDGLVLAAQTGAVFRTSKNRLVGGQDR